MNILILNSVLYTSESKVIPKVESIKDCMIYNLALGFKELGHSVTLVAASEYMPIRKVYDFKVVFIKSHLKKIFLPNILPLQLGIIPFLIKSRKQYDLIISSEVFAFPSLFASVISPKKTLIWQEMAAHNKKMKNIPSYIWNGIIATSFMKKPLIVPRSKGAKEFISHYLKNVSEIVVEHGINLNKFHFSVNKNKQFVVVSQLIERKNIQSIILKFKEFLKLELYSQFKLLIIGRGELEDELKSLVSSKGLQNNVEFLGYMSHFELNKIVSNSMALLVDTKKDLNMVSVPEAIVSGTPVLTNLIPLTFHLIRENNLGIAKMNWNEDDLRDIVENNALYLENCVKFRNELSTLRVAQKLIDCFNNNRLKKK
ncbi:MAG TPA: glycosyltransferase [Bacteroidales bacterium]|nr:glycosyltransferase [Bacteroidales bacterium]